ncbi:MAG: response regulator transcription factor [Acidimicrobiia bacterium]|nr:response regulator transcription factor [Acidimicrobiia bacterium]
MTIRVLLADDHALVRGGLRALLEAEPDIEVVAEAETAAGAVEMAGEVRPDLVVLDVNLPDGSGVDACRRIRAKWSDIQVVMLTAFADEQAFVDSVGAGALGFVLKRTRSSDLLAAVRKAAAGESLLDSELSDRIFSRAHAGRESDPLLAELSPQERKILSRIADGKTNREIAAEMYLAQKTVKNYVSNLLRKLQMNNRAEAAAYAARLEALRESDQEASDS